MLQRILSKPFHYHTFTSPEALGSSSWEDGGERPPLLKLYFLINFSDCVLRGGVGENPQEVEWWLLCILQVSFNDISVLDFKCCTGFLNITTPKSHINHSKAKYV